MGRRHPTDSQASDSCMKCLDPGFLEGLGHAVCHFRRCCLPLPSIALYVGVWDFAGICHLPCNLRTFFLLLTAWIVLQANSLRPSALHEANFKWHWGRMPKIYVTPSGAAQALQTQSLLILTFKLSYKLRKTKHFEKATVLPFLLMYSLGR